MSTLSTSGKTSGGAPRQYGSATSQPGTTTSGKQGGGAPQAMADSVYNRHKSRLDPRYNQAQTDLQTNLANQGFMTNSAGYNKAMDNFTQQRDSAYQDASDASVSAGLGQYNTDRNFGLQAELGRGDLGLRRDLGMGQLGLANRAQGLNEELGRGRLGLAKDQFGFSQEMGRGQLGLQRDQFGFSQEMGRGQLGLQNRAQDLSETMGLGQLDLSRVLGLGNLDLQNQQFGEQQYQNELANMLQLRNQPLHELAILSGLIPTPQFSPNYNTNVGGAAQNQYAGQMNAWNTQNSNNQASMGSLAGLLGTLGSAWMMMPSSHAFKENKRAPEPVLDRLNRLVVEDWNYKPEMGLGQGTHTGPYAEDWAREFGGTGREISVISMMGVMMKAIQELSAKVDRAGAK